MKFTVAILDKHGNSAVNRMLDLLHHFDVVQNIHFGVVLPQKSLFEKSLGILNRQGLESPAIFGCASTRPIVSSNYDFLQLGDSAAVLEGKTYTPISKAALTEQLVKVPVHCETALHTLIEQTDGDYAFWMIKKDSIIAGRDPVGVQPLYYGENSDIVAYATNQSSLWMLGIEMPQSFPPGALGFASKNGFIFKPAKTLTYIPPKQVTLTDAADTLQTLLAESVKRRVCDQKEIAIAFSGGLDSSVIAYLASKCGVKVNLIHVSLENQSETEAALDAAEVLDLPMQIHLYKDSDVEAVLPKVVELIEEPDPLKAAIGIPFYWVAKTATEGKYRVLLAGQGADELFGGYQRYVTEVCNGNSENARRAMYLDVVSIHEHNLARDLKITSFHDVDLRCPFVSYALAEFALGLPLECKIEAKPDTLRKLVLRQVALNLGVPSVIAGKPKKAVQYSTGINNALKRIAKTNGKTVNAYVAELFEHTTPLHHMHTTHSKHPVYGGKEKGWPHQ